MTENQALNELPWTGERLVPSCNKKGLYEHLHRYALAVALAKNKRVLDVACGEGYGSNLLATVAKQVIGIDIDKDVICHAQLTYPRHNLTFREGSCLQIPMPDQSVDLVVSFETIEHIDEHEQFLREIKRVLTPKGALIISSPDKREYTDRTGKENPFHKTELYHEDFERLLRRYFEKCWIGKQRLVSGSWIAPDKSSMAAAFGTFSGDVRSINFETGVVSGLYSIALCSDTELPSMKAGVFENKPESDTIWSAIEQSSAPPMLQVFSDEGQGFSEARSITATLRPNIWQTIRIAGLERLSAENASSRRRYRIDPVDRPASIIISKIAIIRERDSTVVYSATDLADFDNIAFSAGLLKHYDQEALWLIATEADPQILLPPIEIEDLGSCYLEITIQITLDSTAVLSSLHRSAKERNALATRIATLDEKLSRIVNEDSNRISQLEQENKRLGVELQRLNKTSQEQRAQLDDRAKTLEKTKLELQRLKETSQEQRARLDDRVRTLEKAKSDLSAIEASIARFLEQVGMRSKELPLEDSVLGALIKSLSSEIRHIRNRNLLWKAAVMARTAFNRRSGGSQSPETPKIFAREARQKLEGIRRRVKSKKTTPEDALVAFTDLIHLRNRTQELSKKLTAPFLLQLKRELKVTNELTPCSRAVDFSVLFDRQWYALRNPDVVRSGIDALEHYLQYGGREHRDPHPLFDTEWYLSQIPPLSTDQTPLEHYFSTGGKEGRSPHREFDVQFYTKEHPESIANGMTPLVHYLRIGSKQGYRPNPFFDPEFYLRTYPDVAAANVEPFTHFLLYGREEGRKPSPDEISFRIHEPHFSIPRSPQPPTQDLPATNVKAIAFYLPQYHPIPENDRWWGEGFTEWHNVRTGEPSFRGHYQPHIPAELGYYDLRDDKVMQKQAELAKKYGLYGFCFYYYWFGGKVLLDLPIRQMLESGRPDFPFCLCWANENWTRRWDGLENDVLIAQNYSAEDDINFIARIEPFLLRKNYIRIHGKPLLLVYRAALLPNALETTERWRAYFRRHGHGELHLALVRSFHDQTSPEACGFDAAVQFPPHFPVSPVTAWIREKDDRFAGVVYDYFELKTRALEQLAAASKSGSTYAAVMPSWDNTARRGLNATIWANASPELYYEWLSAAVEHIEKKSDPEERLLFINAWNEWAEGCHLEPDEKYGYAWLNATSFALHRFGSPHFTSSETYPEPPKIERIKVPLLATPTNLVISVLFYHREDLIAPFVRHILPQITRAQSAGDLTCSLSLGFNYTPSPEMIAQIKAIVRQESSLRGDAVHFIEHGYNLGFGAGHNFAFQETESDIFLALNSDIHIADEDWLARLVEAFRKSDAAIVGLAQNASRLREDACGIPVLDSSEQFDFVDGSVLAIRSDLARRFGLFSPQYDYFYFEDADLCLRYRQLGLEIALLHLSHTHERSSSSRLLPQFAVETILNRNRAIFFAKWGKYLRRRVLSNRVAIKFLEANRQLQCASLPALFGLLNDHQTAVIDVWGVHAQLVELFDHPRIRLIPSWQKLHEDDYLRYYELASNEAEVPRVRDISSRLGCEPDFDRAKAHLEALISSEHRHPGELSKKKIFVYVARGSPLFDGREPDVKGLARTVNSINDKNLEVLFYTDYGIFEVQPINGQDIAAWRHCALLSGVDLLRELDGTDVFVGTDCWVSDLAQILHKRTFLWLGSTSPAAVLWDAERSACFIDQGLPCLGCYHRFGRHHHNVCLRGDVACMRSELAKSASDLFCAFVEGKPSVSVDLRTRNQIRARPEPLPSKQLSLEQWPRSVANSVLVLTPVSRWLDKQLLDRARELVERALKGMRNSRVVYDDAGEAPPRGVSFPYRLATLAPLRQQMIDRHLHDERWVFWVDADIVDYPEELIDELIHRAEGGIAAPLVLMQGSVGSQPISADGFGPGRFYDIAGFVEQGRWARFVPPFFDQPGPVFELDSVGCCYLVNADLYRHGARHELDHASATFIAENRVWEEDAICQNQRGPANSFSDHYSVCQFARKSQLPVRAFADLIAYHQKV